MKKTNRLKIIGMTSLIAMMFSGIVSASELAVKFSKDLTSGTVTVETVSAPNDVVTVQVLPTDITPEQIEQDPQKGNGTIYVRNAVADEDGKVTFSFPLPQGNYVLNAASKLTDGDYYSQSFNYVDSDVYKTLINQLKSQDKNSFLNTVKSGDNKLTLGFNIDIYSDNAVNRLYDEYKNVLSDTDYELNLTYFKKCALIESLNSNADVDAVMYIRDIYEDDSVLLSYIDKYITTTEIENFFANKMKSTSNRAIADSADLLTTAKEALILTVVKYPGEANNIKLIMNEYKNILGINNVSSYASVYRSLENNEYTTIPLFLDAYNAAVKSDSGSGNGNGNGGESSSGSGGNKVTPSSGTSGFVSFPSTAGQTQNIKIFDDIENVSWAKDAIEGLYKAGIVSGKGNNMFCPQDNVLREEYVKMLVETFDLKLVGKDLPFTDVSENVWYYDYVKTAYIADVVSGISETEFGTGQNIARQDICVMTYRMLNECDVEIPQSKEQIIFNDSAEISDYAKDAVFALQMAGIINGDEAGNFNPKASATRAETAKIMYGILNLTERA